MTSPSPSPAPPGESMARRFCRALRGLECDHTLDPLVALYASGCQVAGSSSVSTHEGPDGARAFWDEYRSSFRSMASSFVTVLDSGDHVAVEWVTDATVEDMAITYGGVTMLDVRDGLITRSRSYFDTRELARHLVRRAPVVDLGADPSAAHQGSPRGGYVP